MDCHSLRNSNAKAVASHLRGHITQHGAPTITAGLLAAIETEALPPTLWYIWLNVSGNCQVISAGLHQSFSQYVRHASITKFGRLFRSERIEEVWDAIGGSSGVISFLSLASVLDVKHFCHEIGRTKGARVRVGTRQRCVDELYTTLCRQDVRPSGANEDQRPLQDLYRDIFPACSADLILHHLEARKLDDPIDEVTKAAIGTHCQFFRDQCVAMLEDSDSQIDVELMTVLLSIKSHEIGNYRDEQLPTDVIFAARILQMLSTREVTEKLNNDTFHKILATPLFKRLRLRKTSVTFVTEVTAAYVAYSRRHVDAKQYISLQHNMAVEYLVRKWSRHTKHLEPCLIELFGLLPKAQVVGPDQIEFLITLVTRPQRFRLLALATQYMPPLRIKAPSDAHQKALPWTSDWTPEIFQLLPKSEARVLFESLIKVKPDPFGPPDMRIDQIHRGPAFFLLTLITDDAERLLSCTKAIELPKTQAMRSRKQPERCFWVEYAIRCAVVSGSVELYRDTLRWAKRFTRDPLTAADMYGGQGHLCQTDTIDLLSGLATDGEASSVETVSERVRTANLICQELLETACEGQMEPNFVRHYWQGVLDLLGAVVLRRLEQVDECQDALQLSDEEVYDVVWRDTLNVALKLEAMGLDEANAKLEYNTLGGPLMESQRWASRPKVDQPRPATLGFFDDLARDRNDMWTAYRQSRRPGTWTLPDHFPRGLPFDRLLPVHLTNCTQTSHMPFLRARAKDVVFVNPDFALAAPPTDEELLSTIGPFWEDYPLALSQHVSWSQNRLEAATHAWQHAVGPLSTLRLSEPEAFLFWSTIFSDRLDGLKFSGPWSKKFDYPQMLELPSNDDMDDGQPLEWNPDPFPKAGNVKTRRLELSNLDVMLDRPFDTRSTADTSLMFEVEGRLPSRSRPAYWDRDFGRDPSVNVKDTIIATALLYISAKNGQSPGLLATPFPSSLNVRYPALYLDGDFLDREDLDSDTAFRMLRQYIDLLPPSLLLALLRGILSAADEKETRTSPDALRILRLLIKCDKPQVALQVVSQVILERPEDSSWQRAILTPGLFKSLSKDTARSFLFSLSTEIHDRLVEQSKKSGDPEHNTTLIKVTTVKMLAQLLSGASFIDDVSACRVLISLLGVAKHIDIVCAVIESLLDALASTSDDTVQDIILTALQQYAVPIMSSVDERRPSENEWTNFETAPAEMPEVFIEDGDATQLPPVWTAMLSALPRLQGSKPIQLFDCVLLPALQGSMHTNSLWLNLFCRHIGAPAIELSHIPLKLETIQRLIASAVHLPAIVPDLWLQLFTTTFDPPPEIRTITQHIEQDSKLLSSNAGKHWLSLFSKSAISVLSRGTQPASLLTTTWTPSANGPKIPQIQAIVSQQADIILDKSGTSLHPWRTFIATLAPPAWQSAPFLLWCQNTKSILANIITRIDALRTPTWQHAKNRSPPILPSTFTLRLWLLCEPGTNSLSSLGTGIQSLLQDLTSTSAPYTDKVSRITPFLTHTLNLSDENKLTLALSLGGNLTPAHNNTFHLADYLRLNLSRQLITGILRDGPRNTSASLRNRIVDLVLTWTESIDEEVRMLGLGMRDVDSSSSSSVNGLWYMDRVEE